MLWMAFPKQALTRSTTSAGSDSSHFLRLYRANQYNYCHIQPQTEENWASRPLCHTQASDRQISSWLGDHQRIPAVVCFILSAIFLFCIEFFLLMQWWCDVKQGCDSFGLGWRSQIAKFQFLQWAGNRWFWELDPMHYTNWVDIPYRRQLIQIQRLMEFRIYG